MTGGARDLPAHQQSLRSTIAWSYDLLDETEKKLFRRLSVFVGGCTLEAAERVTGAEGGGRGNANAGLEIDVVEGIASLMDQALLRQAEGLEGEPRTTMLETIREFALECLEQSGEADAIRRSHASYFVGRAEAARAEARRDRLRPEVDNLQAALKWSAETGGGEWTFQLAQALEWCEGHVSGAIPLDSTFYLVREADGVVETAISRHDSLVLLQGAKQTGKTSLLVRALHRAREAGACVVLTDLQKLDGSQLGSPEAFFLTLAEWIRSQLELGVALAGMWDERLSAGDNFQQYLRRAVLEKIAAPIVWGLDEVDRLFERDFAGEVFGLFRSWHNERSLDPASPWSRLTLAMASAGEAHLFHTDLDESPFNVGTRLWLFDFALDEVAELNRRHGSPLQTEAELERFHRLVGGHPYLVRRGLYEMTTGAGTLATLEAQADREEGPYGAHLLRLLVLLAKSPDLTEVVRGVLCGQPCPTPESFYRLRSAGVLVGVSPYDARPRCQLYATYLRRHLL